MNFDEKIFLYALSSRAEDCKKFLNKEFRPEWLEDARLQPLLKKIFKFTQEHGLPPSLITLNKVMQKEEPEIYHLRYKNTFDELLSMPAPDTSEIIYNLDLANEVAITRSFFELSTNPSIERMLQEHDGKELIKHIWSWLNNFYGLEEDQTMNIREAVNNLIGQLGTLKTRDKIATDIQPLDEWSNGGLRPANIGIIIAPTGHGKSAVLLNIAHNIASYKMRKVWFITNELTMDEQTERFLAKMGQVDLNAIQDNPLVAYKQLEHDWELGLDQRLLLTAVNRETSVNDIESGLTKLIQVNGYAPDVIVLDFMERMRPTQSGYSRREEWIWLGAIAKDLVRLSKKYNLVIWTAAQTNRSGLVNEIISSDMTQGSIRHLQEATCVIGMRQVSSDATDDSPKRVMRFFSLKQRHSKTSDQFIEMEVDLSKMTISEVEYQRAAVEVERSPTADKPQPKRYGYDEKGKRKKKE